MKTKRMSFLLIWQMAACWHFSSDSKPNLTFSFLLPIHLLVKLIPLPRHCSSVGRASFKGPTQSGATLLTWVQILPWHWVVGKILAAPSVGTLLGNELWNEFNPTEAVWLLQSRYFLYLIEPGWGRGSQTWDLFPYFGLQVAGEGFFFYLKPRLGFELMSVEKWLQWQTLIQDPVPSGLKRLQLPHRVLRN